MDSNQQSIYTRYGVTCWIMFMLLTCIYNVSGDYEELPEFLVEEHEIDCPDQKTPALPCLHIPWDTPFRAYKSLPSGVRISKSIIPNGGLGVFSDTFMKKYTILAEFEGEVVIKVMHISDYAWKVTRNGRKSFYVDAHDVATSNWLRWINCSRNKREENVEMFHCKSKLYYVTNREVHPGEELLVYYGDGYAKTLHIDVDNYYDNGRQSDSNAHLNSCTENCSNTEHK